ncbi:hypothetical protein VaNZ11_015127 [Volvox africanus]|uniref:Integrase catalytic domain-containing protein n=1 Tax=Volvox africanus TaxID=51714 RepID=A0ABQ5SK84_9CHLO|nr:hypothetical protein VaNZ11_015127 [Volvox africanus]
MSCSRTMLALRQFRIHGCWTQATSTTSWVTSPPCMFQIHYFQVYESQSRWGMEMCCGRRDVVLTLASSVTIEWVFYVQGFRHNVVSVSVLTDKGCSILFNVDCAKVTIGSVTISATKSPTGLYKFMSSVTTVAHDLAEPCVKPVMPVLPIKVPDFEIAVLWHHRHSGLKRLVQEGLVKGIDLSHSQLRELEGKVCEPCVLGKHSRDPFSSSESVTQYPLQLVHLDVCGPLPDSEKGHRFFVTMLDNYSGISVVQPIQHEPDVPNFIKKGIVLLETHCGRQLKCIRTDNGGE